MGTLCFTASLYALSAKHFPKLWGINRYCIPALLGTMAISGFISKGEVNTYRKKEFTIKEKKKIQPLDRKLYYAAEFINFASVGVFLLAATKWSSNSRQMRLNGFSAVCSLAPFVTKLFTGYPLKDIVSKDFPKDNDWKDNVDSVSFNIIKNNTEYANSLIKNMATGFSSYINNATINRNPNGTFTITPKT